MAEISQTQLCTRFPKGEEPQVLRRVNKYSDFSCVEKVKEILPESLFTKLESTFLGGIIKAALRIGGGAQNANGLGFSGVILHFLLSRVMMKKRKDELWFYFYNQPMRFSLREFHLVTGLPCWEAEDEGPVENELDFAWPLLADKRNRKIDNLLHQLRILGEEDAEESKLRLAMLIVLMGIFLPPYGLGKYTLETEYMDAAKRNIHTYPWGKASFDLLVSSVNNFKSLDFLDLRGFPMALQLWLVASVPTLEGALARLDNASGCFPVCGRYLSTIQPTYFQILGMEKEDVGVISVLSGFNDEEEDNDNLMQLLRKGYLFTDIDWKRGYALAEDQEDQQQEDQEDQHQEDQEVELGDYAWPRHETPTHHLSASVHDQSDADADADYADVDETQTLNEVESGDYAEAPTHHLYTDALDVDETLDEDRGDQSDRLVEDQEDQHQEDQEVDETLDKEDRGDQSELVEELQQLIVSDDGPSASTALPKNSSPTPYRTRAGRVVTQVNRLSPSGKKIKSQKIRLRDMS